MESKESDSKPAILQLTAGTRIVTRLEDQGGGGEAGGRSSVNGEMKEEEDHEMEE
jgi:hypothetical protein